jgi:hypothetical protein
MAMVVLCGNPGCGAVLRVGVEATATQTVIEADQAGRYFSCPRCEVITRLDADPPPMHPAPEPF